MAYVLHAADDALHALSGIGHQLGALADLTTCLVDEDLDLLGGCRRSLRQHTDLAGDDREPAALLAGACRFNRSVEREDVGLEGNAVDHAGNVADPLRRAFDGLHGVDHPLHGVVAITRRALGGGGQFTGLSRVRCILAHGGGQLFHRSGGFLQMRSLSFAALGQCAVAGGDFAGGRADGGGAVLDVPDHSRQLAGGGIRIALDRGECAVILALHAAIKITFGHRREHLPHFVDGAAQGIQQLVDATGQAVEEAGAFAGLQALFEITVCGGIDNPGNGILQRQLMGAVMPFHRKAQPRALCVEHRGDHLGEMHRPDPYLAVMRHLQPVEDAADAVRVGMETMDAAADQPLCVEIGERLAQCGLLVAQQRHHRTVDVADDVIVVGNHHRRARGIKCLADLRVLGVRLGFAATLRLHVTCGIGQRVGQ
ncbi:hypothetical protein D3C81_793410 [compost metagenome]